MEILADTEITRRSGCSAGLRPATLPETREFVAGGRLPTRPHVLEA